MGGWPSRSSSGRRMPARSRCSSSATSRCSTAIRGSSCRTGRTSSASSGTSSGAARRSWPGGSGRSTTCSSRSPPPIRIAAPWLRTSSGRSRRGAAIAATSLNGLGASAGTSGFADVLLTTLGELESGLLEPERVGGDLGRLARAYRDELDRLGLWDRDVLRRRGAERLQSDLGAWGGEPVLAYGFEDLTGAEWALLEALSARTDVTVSIPYEPARAAFAALERTVEDLAGLAAGAIEELPRPPRRPVPEPLAHLERELFADAPAGEAPLDGSIHFLEGAGVRGTVELIAADVLALLRAGTPPERIGIVCDSVERWRAPFESVLGPLGVPYSVEQRARLGETTLGAALLALLRFAWLGGSRGELFAFLRSPFSGLEKRSVDFVEGRLRGRAIADPARVEEESEKLRGAPIPALVELRAQEEPVAAARGLLRTMLRNAWGLESPPTRDDARGDSRAYRAAETTLAELETFAALDGRPVSPEDVVAALERTTVRPSATAGERGRVAVLDYPRARTRLFDAVFLLGLEEGSLPRRDRPSPLLDDDARRELGGRLERPSTVARDRYLFYTACTRATERLVLVREAASDEGVPREPSSFWDDVRSLFAPSDVALATRRRPLSSLTWPLDAAPSERERLRALARLTVDDADAAAALAAANGWSRRLERAREAFERPTRLRNPAVLESMSSRTTFSATELERFADCSSAWLVERVIDPKTIDAEPDAMLRGQVVHTALNRFYSSLPRELDSERVTPENLDAALALVRRCLDDALESGVRLDLTELQAAELRQTLILDLEGFLRDEAEAGLHVRPAPARGRVRLRAGGAGAPARPRPRRRAAALGEDRPHRRRPVERARDRPGLQVGQGRALGARHRPRAAAPDPAVRARAPRPRRDRAARRPLPRALGEAPHARDAARVGEGGPARATCATTTSTRTRSGRRSRPRASGPGRTRSGSARATVPRPEGRRLPAVVRPVDDLPGAAPVTVVLERGRPERRAARRGRGDRRRLRLRRRGHRQDVRARRALRPRGLRARPRRRLDPRHHLHAQGRGRAAHADPGRAPRARAARPRARPRRRLDLDDPRLLQPAAEGAPVRGRARPALPGARGRGRGRAPRRGVRAGAAGVLRERRRGAAAAARDLPRRRAPPHAHRRLRDAALGRSRPRAGARGAARSRGRDRGVPRGGVVPRGRLVGDRRPARPPPPRRSASRPRPRRPSASSTSRRSRAAARGRRRTSRRGRRSSGRRSRSSPRTTTSSSRSCSSGFAAEYAAAKRRESVVDFEDLQLAARDLLRDDESVRDAVRLRFRLVMVDEFQDTNRLQCELVDLVAHPEVTEVFTVGDEFQSIYGFRHADVEVFRERRARASNLLTPPAELPLAAAGARGREPPLRGRVRRRVPAARGLGRVRRSRLRAPGRAHGHGQGELPRLRRALARGRGVRDRRSACARSSTPARRFPARSSSSSPPAPTPSGTRRRSGARACRPIARPGAATSASSRSSTSSPTSACCTTATTTSRSRPSSRRRSSASPTTPSCSSAATRRAGRSTRHSSERFPRVCRPRTSACCARSASATSGSCARRRASASSGCASRCSPSTTTTSPCSRAGTARGGSRTSASSAASRASTTRSAAPTSPASSASSPSRRRSGAKELEAVAEEEGADAVRLLTIHGAKGLEFKVVIVADAGRDTGGPRGGDEIVALSDGRFGFRMVHPTRGDRRPVFDFEAVRDAEREQERAERLRLYYVAMTRAIDRLIVSGAIDPERAADRETPIGWVLDRLDAHESVARPGEDPVELEREEARFLLRVDRSSEPAAAASVEPAAVSKDGQLLLFADLPLGAPPIGVELPELAAPPAPPLHDVRRLSYSALALFERCSYRYFAERVLGLPPVPARRTADADAEPRRRSRRDRDRRRRPPAARARPARRPAAAGPRRARRDGARVVPGGGRGGARPHRRPRRRVLRVRARDAARDARGRPPRAAVRVRARRRAPARPAGRALARGRRRRSSSTTSRTRSTRRIRARSSRRSTASSGSCTRSPASATARRRSRSRTSSSSARTTSSRRRSRARTRPSSRLGSREAIAEIRAGEFRPTPSEFACSDCPALDLVCAGPRLLQQYEM